jgi:DNA-binding HxlR family transcriptional regulator
METTASDRLGQLWDASAARGDVYERACPTRHLLDRVGDKWSVLVLVLLGRKETRFSQLKRDIDGVSQKMLSQTLRALERDGLISRHVVDTVPVAVSYRITALGQDLLAALHLMVDWAERRMPEVTAAQQRFDRRSAAEAAPIGGGD